MNLTTEEERNILPTNNKGRTVFHLAAFFQMLEIF
jgi:hypothetical protein